MFANLSTILRWKLTAQASNSILQPRQKHAGQLAALFQG
jgi:hypothetical protein